MSKPVQQHYLPRGAYLTFFEDTGRPGFIWLYQRGREPVLSNMEKVAKERHLYSFVEKDGKMNTSLEKDLAELENQTRPILAKLNSGPATVELTAAEEFVLAWFVACQAVRTPAQRRVMQDLIGGMLPPDVESEHLRDYALAGNYRVEAHTKFGMIIALEAAKEIVTTFLMKRLLVLRSAEVNFLTCDHPILRLTDPKAPVWFRGGFLMAPVFFPIGSRAALVWMHDRKKTPPRSPGERILVPSKVLPAAKVRQYTKGIISNAEDYLFACEKNPFIRKLFDKTKRPERFELHNPFETRQDMWEKIPPGPPVPCEDGVTRAPGTGRDQTNWFYDPERPGPETV